jgi:apolipoprotein D and lipocalin family protein
MSESRSIGFGRSACWLHPGVALLSVALLGACATRDGPPLEALDRKVDLERFMGDWYVIGFIPITLPFFSEEGAHNGVESYRLTDSGVIETTYTFRKGGFDGPQKRYTPKGWVHDERTNAEWRMQFLWPFKAAYLIVYLDPDYQRTLIGVPDRSHVWILSRDPQLSDAEYERMLGHAADLGYDTRKVQRVPQRWPAG